MMVKNDDLPFLPMVSGHSGIVSLYPNAGSGQRLAGSKSLWLEKMGNYGSTTVTQRIHGTGMGYEPNIWAEFILPKNTPTIPILIW